jgi:hypothetical protein
MQFEFTTRRDGCVLRTWPTIIKELKMSRINGDKARDHRRRKNKIARRIAQKQLYKELTEAVNSASSASAKKTKAAE